MWVIILLVHIFGNAMTDDSYVSYEPLVACNAVYKPDNCGLPKTTLNDIATVADLDRCGPSVLQRDIRNFYWGAAGRKITYRRNFEAFDKLDIIPRLLQDVSKNTVQTTVLGSTIAFPVGIAPSAVQKLASPLGEIATARAAASMGTIMILSSMSQTRLEDVAQAAFSVNPNAILWMQVYILRDRNELMSIISRAARAGYKAIVVTVDSPVNAVSSCDARFVVEKVKLPNFFNETFTLSKTDASLTFKDLAWLTKATNLPVVAKGPFTGQDAKRAVQAGVKGILVSNHGGRQLDGGPSTIEMLPEVVQALRYSTPVVEAYLDGGVRDGWDVLKVLASGAKAAFVGRPAIWGLAIGGEKGVEKMLTIMKNEFNETMLISGYSSPYEISLEAQRRMSSMMSYKMPNFEINEFSNL